MVEGCGKADEPYGTQFGRAAYIHKAEHLDERKMLQWWADFLDANREKDYAV
jgi:hypothetical protein